MYKTVARLQVAQDIFIDASTGRCYPIPSSPFLGIESMWNHDNYWVCMQMPEPHSDSRATPQHLSLDVTDASKWEYMLPTALPQVTIRNTCISLHNCYQRCSVLHYSCRMTLTAVVSLDNDTGCTSDREQLCLMTKQLTQSLTPCHNICSTASVLKMRQHMFATMQMAV